MRTYAEIYWGPLGESQLEYRTIAGNASSYFFPFQLSRSSRRRPDLFVGYFHIPKKDRSRSSHYVNFFLILAFEWFIFDYQRSSPSHSVASGAIDNQTKKKGPDATLFIDNPLFKKWLGLRQFCFSFFQVTVYFFST